MCTAFELYIYTKTSPGFLSIEGQVYLKKELASTYLLKFVRQNYQFVTKMVLVRKSLLISVIVMVMIQKNAMAAQHVVGGSQGWDESADFKSWASGQTFKVGDTLVFRYNPGLHSVVELEGDSSYKSCDISSTVNSMSAGNDVVKLNKPGTRYFACGTAGHCDQGMKLKIKTVTGSAPSNQEDSSTPSSSSAASHCFSTAFFTFIVAILTVQMALVFLL